MKRKILFISIASLIVLAIVGNLFGLWATLNRSNSSDAPQSSENSAKTDAATTPPLDPNEHGYFDSSLAKQMVIYNQQASELANIVRQDAADERIKEFANEMMVTHDQSAKQYASWLEIWNETYFNLSYFPRKDDHDAYPTNPGMPRVAELDSMLAMAVADKEKEFLRLSLQLHEGILDYMNMTERDIQYGEMRDYIKTDKTHYIDEIAAIKNLQQIKEN